MGVFTVFLSLYLDIKEIEQQESGGQGYKNVRYTQAQIFKQAIKTCYQQDKKRKQFLDPNIGKTERWLIAIAGISCPGISYC